MKVRIIPVLTIKDGKLVKTIQFHNPRNLNSPMAAVRLFNSRNVDEMVILFIDGKVDFTLCESIASECFMPLTIGGGIRDMDDVDRLFSIGADKVLTKNLRLIPKIAAKYGSQAVVFALDHGLTYPEDDFTKGNIKAAEKAGAGEILLTSCQYEGLMAGYELEWLEQAVKVATVPTIANGGAGRPDHFLNAYQTGVSALAASSIWYYSENTPQMVKEYLHKYGVSVRLN